MILGLLLAAALSVPSVPARPVTTLEATSAPADVTGVQKDHLPLAPLPDSRLTVGVTVGGQGPFRFLVDTGADRTAISHQLAERLGLAPGRGVRMHSVTGMTHARTAAVRDLRVAARALPDVTAPLLDANHVRADGILGTDVLRSALVRFDFRAGLLSISTPRRRAQRDGDDTIVVEARQRAGRLIVTEAEADGQRLVVVLDTGSEVTIGNRALRAALNRRRLLREGGNIELASVTGEKLPATYMALDELRIGGLTLTDLGIAFADAHTFAVMGLTDRPALLLGMNALHAFDSVTIDLAARKLRFDLPSGEAREVSGRRAS